MAIEKRNGIFYELLIRGAVGAAHADELPLGSFVGAHYIEGEAIVEDGVVKLFTPGVAQDLPRDKIADYLGEKFTGFEEGRRAEIARAAADAEAKAAELAAGHAAEKEQMKSQAAAALADLQARAATAIEQLQASRDADRGRIAELESQLGAANAAVATLTGQIDAATRMLAPFGSAAAAAAAK